MKKRSFKSSRHFAAIQLTNRNIPIEVVRKFIVHQSINTTMIYSMVKTETLNSGVDALADSGHLLFKIISVFMIRLILYPPFRLGYFLGIPNPHLISLL